MIDTRPTIKVPGIGNKNAKIVLVGEAPGAEEVKFRKPFVGAAGRLLDKLLHDVGIVRSELYITNVIKERPPKNDISHFFKQSRKGLIPNDKALKYIEELKQELSELKPNLIIALGSVPAWVLTGKSGITKIRGSIYPSTMLPGVKVMPMIHPAAALRQYVFTHMIKFDLNRAKREAEFPEIRRVDRVYRIRPSFEEAMQYMDDILKNYRRVAFDIEVINLELGCFSLAKSEKDAIVIPFYENGQSYFNPEQEATIIHTLGKILENPDINIIGQNLVFDGTFMFRKYGIAINNVDDTMIAHAIIYPDLPKGLDFITSIYTDEPYYKDDGKKWMRIGGDIEEFWIYNAKDSLVCYEAMPKLEFDLKRSGLYETYTHQRDLIYPLIFMGEHGIKMNVDGMTKASEDLERRLEELQKELNEIADGINPNSPKQLIEYFYIKKGLAPYINRKTGKPTVDVDALKRLARKGIKEAVLILNIRKISKLKSTYLDVKLDPDNRLRCSFNPVGTKSGRLSSSKTIFDTGMNMQNQPEEMKKYMLADDGFLIYNVDLSQAENRIVAYIAPEPKMIKAFEEGIDVHSLTASLIFNEPIEKIIEEHNKKIHCNLGTGDQTKRFWGKKANHSLNYGLGYRTFALYYEMPEKDAKFIVDRYHEVYPGVRNYHQWVRYELGKTRSITNLYGRKRIFLGRWGDELFKEAYSFIPQSTVADKINRDGLLLIYNDPEFKDVRLLNQVHDSLVFEIPLSLPLERHVYLVKRLIKSLEKPLTFRNRTFVIPAEVEVGFNLFETVELDPSDDDKAIETLERLTKGDRDETQSKNQG